MRLTRLLPTARALALLPGLALALAGTAHAQYRAPPPSEPSADYVEPGQDAAGYRLWLASQPARATQVEAFDRYLALAGVSGIVPTWQLLRTASEWRRCGDEAFEVPPSEYWGHLVNTLRYARDQVVPAVGAIEAVSVYRNARLNQCAGGAAQSSHRAMFAVDFVPRFTFARADLMRRLCTVHAKEGRLYDVGFGFYKGLRFHIDNSGYRIWGVSPVEGGWPCEAALLRREEARTVAVTASSAAVAARPATAPAPPGPSAIEPVDPLAALPM